ncbi:hypothetical protein CCACVL1_25354 [Corchorus capsularis]|uniref:Uncharacterized protein n=1 Tax=Corchorus capsularis TaxID=210143 RepID=A0A1R3GL16_COCAP|nr:hypothetical protein CCACVL1_25354 [Corchorus capsularis]
MGKTTFCGSGNGLKKGAWTAEEDRKLIAYVQEHGEGSWRNVPEGAGLQRCGKSCRLRWANYLRPGIRRGDFTSDEEETIIQLQAKLGNRWSAIAKHLPRRTDNEIKNFWNAHLKKRLATMTDHHDPLPSPSSNENSNIANPPIAHTESVSATQESDQQPKTMSSRPTSASALLLNKLASKVTTLQCVDGLRLRACPSSRNMQSMSSSSTSDIWPDDVLSSERSIEYNAAESNMEYPLSDSHVFSNILPAEITINTESESSDVRGFSNTWAPSLSNMGSKLFAWFNYMDGLDDCNDNLPLHGPDQFGDGEVWGWGLDEFGMIYGSISINCTVT